MSRRTINSMNRSIISALGQSETFPIVNNQSSQPLFLRKSLKRWQQASSKDLNDKQALYIPPLQRIVIEGKEEEGHTSDFGSDLSSNIFHRHEGELQSKSVPNSISTDISSLPENLSSFSVTNSVDCCSDFEEAQADGNGKEEAHDPEQIENEAEENEELRGLAVMFGLAGILRREYLLLKHENIVVLSVMRQMEEKYNIWM